MKIYDCCSGNCNFKQLQMHVKKFRTSTGFKPRAFSSHHHSVMMMIVKMKVMVMMIHVIFTMVMSMMCKS